jgi:site-specific recombinase XerD
MNYLLANYMKRYFSHYLPVQKGLSVNTIHAYRDAIKLLLCYTADTLGRPVDGLTVQDITEKVVVAYLDHVEQKRKCSPNTRNARLAAIRSIFAFIAREEPSYAKEFVLSL